MASWKHCPNLFVFSVSFCWEYGTGLPVVPPVCTYLKRVMCNVHGSRFCCSSSWCHCPPSSMWHERTSPMPDKGGQPMRHKPEANGWSTGDDWKHSAGRWQVPAISTQQGLLPTLCSLTGSKCVRHHGVSFWALALPLSSSCPCPSLWDIYLMHLYCLDLYKILNS